MSVNIGGNQSNQEPNFHLSKTTFSVLQFSFYRYRKGEVTPKRRVASFPRVVDEFTWSLHCFRFFRGCHIIVFNEVIFRRRKHME